MTKNEFARQVALSAAGGGGNPRLGDWTDWVETILTLIAGIPCLNRKSPEEARQWLSTHPMMARIYVRPIVKRKRPSWATDDDVDAAYDALMESAVMATSGEFAAVFAEAKR